MTDDPGNGAHQGSPLPDYAASQKVSTVPETFYFPIFAFVHRSLTVPSPCVQRALSVRSSFTDLRSVSPFARVHLSQSVRHSLTFVHLSFTKRSSFIQRSVFIVIWNSEVERSISRSWNEVMIKR